MKPLETIEALSAVAAELIRQRDRETSARRKRCLSIAVTEAETALLWYTAAQQPFPHDPEPPS